MNKRKKTDLHDYDYVENFESLGPDKGHYSEGEFQPVDDMGYLHINGPIPTKEFEQFYNLFIVPGGVLTVNKNGNMDNVRNILSDVFDIESIEPGNWDDIPQDGTMYCYDDHKG
jgi:hypothetical protein